MMRAVIPRDDGVELTARDRQRSGVQHEHMQGPFQEGLGRQHRHEGQDVPRRDVAHHDSHDDRHGQGDHEHPR